jgi:hypothetical protein
MAIKRRRPLSAEVTPAEKAGLGTRAKNAATATAAF